MKLAWWVYIKINLQGILVMFENNFIFFKKYNSFFQKIKQFFNLKNIIDKFSLKTAFVEFV